MRHRRLSVCVLTFTLLAGSTTSASGCNLQHSQKGAKPAPTPATQSPTETPVPTNEELKELAAGAYGSVRESFVAVARDAETYALLRPLVKDLPEQPADFFQTHAVVAAFLGQRRSGGYRVEIKRTERNTVSLVEQGPPKDAMVTMALTAPFRVVALPINTNEALTLTLDQTWQQSARPYRVTDGEVTVSGGFAGIRERARLEGTLRIMRAGQLATFMFDVRSAGGQTARRLVDTATGSVDGQGRVTLTRIDAFALSGAVETYMRATGELKGSEHDLSLSFEIVPAARVADNFGAQGKLAAVATAPAPPKKAVTDEPM